MLAMAEPSQMVCVLLPDVSVSVQACAETSVVLRRRSGLNNNKDQKNLVINLHFDFIKKFNWDLSLDSVFGFI